MLLVLCKQVCWRRAPHLDKASLFPACALFANTNPAPLEGHPRVKIKPRHTPSHWSASQQTFPREWSWSLRLRIQQGSGGVREMRGRGALQKTTPMNSEAAVAILASDSLAQVAVSCQHSQGLLDHRGLFFIYENVSLSRCIYICIYVYIYIFQALTTHHTALLAISLSLSLSRCIYICIYVYIYIYTSH